MSHVPCKFFKQGTCTAGANCTFSHSSDLSSESAVCKYFVKGNCKFGTKCALLHTMSPFGTSGSSSNKRMNGMVIGTPPAPTSFLTSGNGGRTRKTSTTTIDQMTNSFAASTSLDHRSFLNDPFGTSAPAAVSSSFFLQQQDLWRNQQQDTAPTADYLLGTSPFSNNSSRYMQQLSSSLRSSSNGNNGSGGGGIGSYFNSIPLSSSSAIESNNSYRTRPATYLSTSSSNNNIIHEQQQLLYEDDLNDAMLPSSLNDLFTPTELHVRRVRQQQQYPMSYDSSFITRDTLLSPPATLPHLPPAPPSSFDQQQQQKWRVPFLTKSNQGDYMTNSTAAINIPPMNNYGNNTSSTGSGSNGSGGSGSSASYMQQQQQQGLFAGEENEIDHLVEEEDVQFFMEDDVTTTYDQQQQQQQQKQQKKAGYNGFPSLISLPST